MHKPGRKGTGRGARVMVALAIGCACVPARAQDLESQLRLHAQQYSLEGRRGPSLFQPGFGVAEYGGWARSSGQSSDAAGIFTSSRASTTLEVSRPGLAPVTGQCQGGQGRIALGWITFSRERLTYVCNFGGGAPPGSEFDLAQSSGGGGLGGLFQQLAQPQRAGEMHYGPVILRAQTRYISGIPLSGGGANSYVVTRPDGTPVGALQTNGFRPRFWLPREPGPERDAAALLLLTLFSFQDPGQQPR